MILSWFLNQTLSAGDWPYLYRENIFEFLFPPKWPFTWITPFYQLAAKIFVQYLGFSWEVTERIVWFWPFWILSALSCWYLSKVILGFKSYFLFLISYLLFGFNTYILMVVGGGQMGVALAYSLAPLVLGLFMGLSRPILAGLILAAQLMFDPRIGFITLLAVGFSVAINKTDLKKLILPLGLALVLNSFWILPAVSHGFSLVPEGYTSPEGFKFLSIADFSHALSLLHPYWPENIFGKVGLTKPEFLILPILAYSSLLFAQKNRQVLLFVILALIGAFLAKGVNPPAGFVNLWLFNHVPGFNLFRDPTKFYVLVALSYSVLIPFSLEQIFTRVSSIKYQVSGIKILNTCFLILVSFLVYWLFLVRPLWLGELGGTFKAREVPPAYLAFKGFLVNDRSPSKVLWLPRRQRFGFQSHNHPAVELEQFVSDEKCLEPFCPLRRPELGRAFFRCFPNEHCFPADASFLANPKTPQLLVDLSIKYLVIPYDSEGEIFVKERAYDEPSRQKLVGFVGSLNYLRPVNLGSKISVYEVLR